jgi:hypothetical protein
VTVKETIDAIHKLNSGKAADPSDLQAEHFKLGATIIAPHLSLLLTGMMALRYIPQQLHSGTMIPIPKNGKDPLQQTNYRGITLIYMIIKTLEHVLLARDEHLISRSQNGLQVGFTRDMSPSWGSLMFTEALAESKDKKLPTFAAALDVQKAFDTVWHDSLMRKLHLLGVENNWLLRRTMLDNLSIRVRVGDSLSRPVKLSQGVGQGRPWSTHDYKVMINDLLNTVIKSGLGTKIGPYTLAAPTCADDMLVVTNDEDELQLLLDIVLEYSRDERYIIHPTKSMILIYDKDKPSDTEPAYSWTLGDSTVPVSSSCRHLGLERYSEDRASSKIINDSICTARRASYALMVSGFHGNNGNSPAVVRQMYVTYVIPRCIYGLESMVLKKSHLEALERYHRKTLKQLMSLPQRTATEAVHLLAGVPPITALLHIKALSLLGAIARSPDSIMYQIGLRQLAVKEASSNSWFVFMSGVTALYDLPSPHELFETAIPKARWKTLVKKHVYNFYQQQLHQTARSKSTLVNLHTDILSLQQPSLLLSTVRCSMMDVMRARVHLRLITGTYTLQRDRAKFYKSDTDPTCLMCATADEDITHFLAQCPSLREE